MEEEEGFFSMLNQGLNKSVCGTSLLFSLLCAVLLTYSFIPFHFQLPLFFFFEGISAQLGGTESAKMSQFD